MRNRRAEERHHRVADELLDRAAVSLELAADPGVIGPEHGTDVLGIEPFRLLREADEVAEEDGDDFSLLSRRTRCGQR